MTTNAESAQARSTAEMPLPVRIEWQDSSCRVAVLDHWRILETRLTNRRLTCSSLWTSIWLTHYGDGIAHRFAVAYRGDRLVGICLVCDSADPPFGPVAVRTSHLGTAGERDEESVCIEYNTVLVHDEDRSEVLVALQHSLMRDSRCDAVAWDGFEPLPLPQDVFSVPGNRTVIKPTFYFDLQRARAAAVEPLTLLGESTRQSIRRNLRAYGEIQVDWSTTAADAEQGLTELIQLHQNRWQSMSKPGAFISPRFCAFHQELTQRLVLDGRAAVVRVRAGQQTIGCTLLHMDQNRALVYQNGWTPDPQGKLSPGLISDYACLCECLRRGFDAYDFMAGDSTHKRRLTTNQGQLAWGWIPKPSWKHRAVGQLRSAKRYCQNLFHRPAISTLLTKRLASTTESPSTREARS